jgi:hypothetical protein
MNLCSLFSYSVIEFFLQMFMAHDVKLKRLLIFTRLSKVELEMKIKTWILNL